MSFKKIPSFTYFLLIMFSIQSSFAGGHTGNGGGVVTCPGKKPVVLDYYEVVSSKKKVIDLESMTRDEFFSLIIERLKLGEKKYHSGKTGFVSGPQPQKYHLLLAKKVDLSPGLHSWPIIDKWSVRDEFLERSLPKNCVFDQVAITSYVPQKGFISYRVKGKLEALSKGQLFVLELHEFFQEHNWNGSSISVRELIGTLLLKKMTYKDIRLALYRFIEPKEDYDWKLGRLVLTSFNSAGKFNLEGLYALNLVGLKDQEKNFLLSCPRWLGISTANRGNNVLQLFEDSASPSEDLFMPGKTIKTKQGSFIVRQGFNSYELTSEREAFSLREDEHHFLFQRKGKNCPYHKIDHRSDFVQNALSAYRKENRLFPFAWEGTYYVQRIRTYYEQQRLGIISEYEAELHKIRELLNW